MVSDEDTDYETLPVGPPQHRKPTTKTYSKKARQRATRSAPAAVEVKVPTVVPGSNEDGATTSSEEVDTALTSKGKRVKGNRRQRIASDGRLRGREGHAEMDDVRATEKAREREPKEQEVRAWALTITNVKTVTSTQAPESTEEAETAKAPLPGADPIWPSTAGTRDTRVSRAKRPIEAKIPFLPQFSSTVPPKEQSSSSISTSNRVGLPDPFVDSARTVMRPRSKKASALSDKSNLPKRSCVTSSKLKESTEMPSLESMSLHGGEQPSEAEAIRSNAPGRTGSHSKLTKPTKKVPTQSTMGIFHDPSPAEADAKNDKKPHARALRTSSKSKAQACAATVVPVSSVETPSLSSAGRARSLHLSLGSQRSGYGQLPPPTVPIAAGAEESSHSYHPSEDDLSRHSSIVIETYEMTEREASESDEEGDETIQAAINPLIANPTVYGQEVLNHAESEEVVPAPGEVDVHPTGGDSSPEEATGIQTPDAHMTMAEPVLATKGPEQLPESEFLSPGRALPPRHRQLPLAQPRPGGPGSDEDDLAYYLAITATSSSGDEEQQDARDREQWLKGEAEVGKGVEPGWTMEQAQARRRYILKKLPDLQGEEDSDDELNLRGEVSRRDEE
ncbi:BZ3500_MvSof-1268-A1-R1_Chr7-1g09420 [Microbotryum saponariae]|uniref:BZ3500_MvSof-1268-A1-R1_Chr7-1g09420 protein n=1 Tax=Microbotryum saponariae TaxID=289078 RepID=A0A2X0NDQ6_9BASI|nr:BZ3501_MvSof-1269-A2-R1_Chr7-1g09125 [Microbotryum saponariae]SDA03406.1 BZ3500_MvSof-1268-A1-R1_Chr7-1g09420 [Microbotryum saponariae]